MPFKKYQTLIEILLFWIMPLGLLIFLLTAFNNLISSASSAFFILFPALTMYLVVGIGSGYCKFWYFNTILNFKGVALTVGLVYSAVVNLGAWLLFDLFESRTLLWVLGIGLFCSIVGTIVDIFLLGSGLFYTKSKKFPPGSNPLKHALSYGPVFFGIVGLWNAVGLLTGSYLLDTSSLSAYVITPLLSILFALPFALYFLRKLSLNKTRRISKNSSELTGG